MSIVRFCAALSCAIVASAASPRALHARPQELAAYGIWEGAAGGGLHLQASFPLRSRIEIAGALLASAGPRFVHGGVFAGPRFIFDLAHYVPAVTFLAGVIGDKKFRAGIVAQAELLRFLRPHTGMTIKAGVLWTVGYGVAPQVGLGYFWRA